MTTFYVVTNGLPTGNGSASKPWDLQTALKHPVAVKPGDTISVQPGTYKGNFISDLAGTIDRRIIVQGQRARLDGGANLSKHVLRVRKPFVSFMNLEITRSGWKRRLPGMGFKGAILVYAPNTKIINCIIHDTPLGIGAWSNSQNTELYGNIIYYNGWVNTTNNGGNGHGIYVQEKKIIRDNIVFQNFREGITPHSGISGLLYDIALEGNICFCSGLIRRGLASGGSQNLSIGYWGGSGTMKPIQKLSVFDNCTYYPPSTPLFGSLALNAPTNGARFEDNYFVGGYLNRKHLHPGGTFEDNVILAEKYNGNWTPASEPQNSYCTWSDLQNFSVVRKNDYDLNRAHIAIYNPKGLSTVPVNISSLGWPDSAFRLINVQDYFKDTIPVVSKNRVINIPMNNHTVAAPVDWKTPQSTFPKFGVFVLLR